MVIKEADSMYDIIEKYMAYLDGRNYSYATIRNYRDGCNAIEKYIEENSLGLYNADICQEYYIS